MPHTLSKQDEMHAAFAQIAQIIRTEEHNDASLIGLIADSMDINPDWSQSFARHSRDVLNEATGEINYTDVIVEAYRRSLFDIELCKKYDTDYFEGNPDAAREYVGTVVAAHAAGKHAGFLPVHTTLQ